MRVASPPAGPLTTGVTNCGVSAMHPAFVIDYVRHVLPVLIENVEVGAPASRLASASKPAWRRWLCLGGLWQRAVNSSRHIHNPMPCRWPKWRPAGSVVARWVPSGRGLTRDGALPSLQPGEWPAPYMARWLADWLLAHREVLRQRTAMPQWEPLWNIAKSFLREFHADIKAWPPPPQ